MSIKYFAFPSQGWSSAAEHEEFRQYWRAANPSGYYVNFGFNNVDELVAGINRTISQDSSHPCLEYLEIWCHGCPSLIDGLTLTTVAHWGTQLKGITSWCDNAVIYLAGCNTGLADGGMSIAERLAGAMKFDAGNFAHRITVHGSNGYLRSNHAMGGEVTTPTLVSTGESIQRGLRFVYGFLYGGLSPTQGALEAATVDITFKPYAGARNASGANCWNAFPNWP
jgi:hypothetical protein